jgi:hypothetical protein
MITDQEAFDKYEAMRKEFGDKLCDPDTEPKQFAYQVMLFKRFHDTHKDNPESE